MQILLDDFKASNKKRKQTLATRYGFDTPEEYLSYLEGKEVIKETISDDSTEGSPTDIVIAFDTTGSMASYIEAVKKHVESLIPDLFAKTTNLKIKIVAFGDYCDMVSERVFGKAYQESSLTDNVNILQKFVKNAINTSGGDSEEFYELVIKKITEETQWRKESNRSILLIADDSPHSVGYNYRQIVRKAQIDWRVEAQKAKNLNIKIDTLMINDYHPWYKELSEITGGVNLKFQSSAKTATLLEGYAYARSGSAESFAETRCSAAVTSDEELKGVYKQLGELL